MGSAQTTVNGTSSEHRWAAWIGEEGPLVEWNLRAMQLPPPLPPTAWRPRRDEVGGVDSHNGGLLVVTFTSVGVFGLSDLQPDAEASQVDVSHLRADGTIESTTLDIADLTRFLQVPFLAAWEETPTRFVIPFESPDPDEGFPLYVYRLENLSAQETVRTVPPHHRRGGSVLQTVRGG